MADDKKPSGKTRAGGPAKPFPWEEAISEQYERTKSRLKGLATEPEAELQRILEQYLPKKGDSPEERMRKLEDLAMGFAGTVIKNPAPFKVAHGTNAQFDEFQRGMGVTAKHIYTTPESLAADAAGYGKNVIKAEASPKKMIDFSDYDRLDKTTINAIKKAAKDAGITDKYYPFESFLNDVMSGQMYQVGGGQKTQNAFLIELFSDRKSFV